MLEQQIHPSWAALELCAEEQVGLPAGECDLDEVPVFEPQRAPVDSPADSSRQQQAQLAGCVFCA
jgi:hypothetical protein